MATYLVGMAGCLVLLRQRRVAEAIFYAWVVHMQLIEFFLWKHQPCSDEHAATTNQRVTGVGVVVNHLEPIVLWLAIVAASNRALPGSVHAVLLVFTVCTVFHTRHVLQTLECTTVTPASHPHLHWKWADGYLFWAYYLFFLLSLLLLAYYGLTDGTFHAGIILCSFLASFAIYKDKHAVGAMWCFAAAFVPWLLAART